MQVKPTADHVVVEIEPREETLPSGIVVGVSQIERPWILFGRAKAVGPKAREVEVGDRVMLKKDQSRLDLTESGGPETVLVRETQIEGVIDDG